MIIETWFTCCKEGNDRWMALEGGKLLPTWQWGVLSGVRRPGIQKSINCWIRLRKEYSEIANDLKLNALMNKYVVACFYQVSCYATFWYKENCPAAIFTIFSKCFHQHLTQMLQNSVSQYSCREMLHLMDPLLRKGLFMLANFNFEHRLNID